MFFTQKIHRRSSGLAVSPMDLSHVKHDARKIETRRGLEHNPHISQQHQLQII
jgi:hypothetical protein